MAAEPESGKKIDIKTKSVIMEDVSALPGHLHLLNQIYSQWRHLWGGHIRLCGWTEVFYCAAPLYIEGSSVM